MARDLTTSQVDRQNILNNENAVAEIQNQTGLQGIMFEGRLRFTKAMFASFFEVEVRTIERYVSENIEEISANGYEVIKGKRLKDFLNCVLDQDWAVALSNIFCWAAALLYAQMGAKSVVISPHPL